MASNGLAALLCPNTTECRRALSAPSDSGPRRRGSTRDGIERIAPVHSAIAASGPMRGLRSCVFSCGGCRPHGLRRRRSEASRGEAKGESRTESAVFLLHPHLPAATTAPPRLRASFVRTRPPFTEMRRRAVSRPFAEPSKTGQLVQSERSIGHHRVGKPQTPPAPCTDRSVSTPG